MPIVQFAIGYNPAVSRYLENSLRAYARDIAGCIDPFVPETIKVRCSTSSARKNLNRLLRHRQLWLSAPITLTIVEEARDQGANPCLPIFITSRSSDICYKVASNRGSGVLKV
jgi:hypothetical protein